ncbi:MAG: prepilin-type N-terminal cleavage/methylation domain-containing protein [Gemmatimonadaceae bacterium]
MHAVSSRERRLPAGFTLFELVVALVVMGIAAALVMPSLSVPRPESAGLRSVLPHVRGVAIARAQTLAFSVAADGAWTLAPRPPDDSVVFERGRLDPVPSSGFELTLTPVGACLASARLPVELGRWDAARCSPLAHGARSR